MTAVLVKRRRSLGVADLRAECELLVPQAKGDAGVAEAAIDAMRPGGAENADGGTKAARQDVRAWLRFYRWLHRTLAIAQAGRQESVAPSSGEADGAALLALASVPEVVSLRVPVEDRDRVTVYAKSPRALAMLHAIELRQRLLTSHFEAATDSMSADAAMIRDLALEGMVKLHHLAIWMVTTPGCGLPWNPATESDPQPPAWVAQLDALDIHQLLRANAQVHSMRLLAMEPLLFPSKDSGVRRPSWSIFGATAAQELGISDHELHYERDLPSIVAAMRLRGSAQREAHAAAETAAKQNRR